MRARLVGWLSPTRFALLWGAFVVLLYPDVAFGIKAFVFRDFGLMSYPMANFHRELFWQGEVPLWNPSNNAGIPFLAQWSALILYPISILYLVLPMLAVMAQIDFDLATTVLLPAGIDDSRFASHTNTVRIEQTQWHPARIDCAIEAEGPGWVVVSQTHYPAWKATLNGSPMEIVLANHAYQAVPVPAGSHQLELRYSDRTFGVGLGLQLAGGLGCIAGWKRSRRSTQSLPTRAARHP